MLYVLMLLMGMGGGGLVVFLALQERGRKVKADKRHLEAQARKLRQANAEIMASQQELKERADQFKAKQDDFDRRVVSYTELRNENAMLKRDLQNVDVNLRKLQLDRELQRQAQEALDQRCGELGSRYLKENVKRIGSSLTANNFVASKQRLQDVIQRCRGIGFAISGEEEAALLGDLKAEFERIVRAALQREEQARIKAQIREEQRLEREIQRELERLDRERAAIKAALEKALQEARDEHSEEVQRLRARLAEAEANSQRAISRAQMTKSGYVYVISNVGSFGEDVFKVGMTRRLEPNDRVRELGDASVPFPFDVHMMISCDDAPTLENALHRALHRQRLNRINPRKEFYRADLDTIRKLVEENHGQVEYVADPEALEYRQSLSVSEEDSEFIEHVYEEAEAETGGVQDDK